MIVMTEMEARTDNGAESARLRAIVNAGARRLTKGDKAYIDEFSAACGRVFTPTNCNSCYIDEAVALLRSFHVEQTTQGSVRLADGVDIVVNGRRINAATIGGEEDCRALLDLGVEKKYFTFASDED